MLPGLQSDAPDEMDLKFLEGPGIWEGVFGLGRGVVAIERAVLWLTDLEGVCARDGGREGYLDPPVEYAEKLELCDIGIIGV